MKKILTKAVAILALGIAMSVSSQIKAQSSNNIEEVTINSKGLFGELRQLVVSNFDFTNPNLTEGTTNSVLEFSVAEDGKITNVHAKGGCKYVSEELEHVMKSLLYKVDVNKLNKNLMASTFIMPVSVNVNSK
ncbi:hypothetical protein [Chryseobacterium koreense]|uniref:TonB C-terminal domain-containing protein n=1 Tax=Chryseobacterium koreense CCUG 49689 TaxID=1304281 RepID=A0A0J7J288_9FLAO|nr:hypothetical protein [Chryseobacterium koreense]KMQ72397.1 hypothetical protein ACM44_01245 [Chryseobacterium koreense CCUG 49689]MBB5333518.1 hypothetical protein [Chryseobacterium koreense]